MTVLHRDSNGRASPVVPLREEDIITPQALAKLIADEVAKQLEKALTPVRKKFAESIELAAQIVARRVGSEAGNQLAGNMREMADYCKKAVETVSKRAEDVARENLKHSCGITQTMAVALQNNVKATETFCQSLQAQQDRILKGIRGASVQTLTGIIQEEITKHDFEQLIRDELRTAVRAALSPPKG